MPRGKKSSRPPKRSKPLSARKGIQDANKRMLDFFSARMQEVTKAMESFEGRVGESNQQLWKNQQLQSQGLSAAEEHVAILRRVLNDALGGVTRVKAVERKNPAEEEAQVIDWAWYAVQLHFTKNKEDFVIGEVLEDEVVAERTEKEDAEKRRKVVLYLAGKAAETDEDALRAAFDEGGLEDVLKAHLPAGIEWDDETVKIAPDIVELVLERREAARAQQAKVAAQQELAVLGGTVAKVAAGEPKFFDMHRDEQVKLIQEALPSVMEWTERMSEAVGDVVDELHDAHAKAEAENDPEEVEAAKQELLEETKRFGEKANGVIDLIEAGKEDEARAKMAELDKLVKDKEAEAGSESHVPEGATIFGG